ncbi:hypothetical protein MAPG_01299 [Magnaporthiopsis poae ATCC 64411]|uniref:Uncharacterized protein n=1 Tax=Magnaporthiopsis poae (strain ATCC 64411 / 73-15) TaxID=644358 RepID=A0A0C4DNB8_MAGP6|nr:hypothetical protein MAPG_01299 [Magnaporthiopsis poae ATCC 64411]
MDATNFRNEANTPPNTPNNSPNEVSSPNEADPPEPAELPTEGELGLARLVREFMELPRPRVIKPRPQGRNDPDHPEIANDWQFCVLACPARGELLLVFGEVGSVAIPLRDTADGPIGTLNLDAMVDLLLCHLLRTFIDGVAGNLPQVEGCPWPYAPYRLGTHSPVLVEVFQQRLAQVGIQTIVFVADKASLTVQKIRQEAACYLSHIMNWGLQEAHRERAIMRSRQLPPRATLADLRLASPLPTWDEARELERPTHPLRINCQTCIPFGDEHYRLPSGWVQPAGGKSAIEFYETENSPHHLEWRTRIPDFGDMARLLVWSNARFPDRWWFLFGPNTARDLCELYMDARIEMLLDPPRGSPRYRQTLEPYRDLLTSLSYQWDSEMARASVYETRQIHIVREMQEHIKWKVPQGQIMTCHHAVLTLKRYGPTWYRLMPLFRIAVDNLNQDAPWLG